MGRYLRVVVITVLIMICSVYLSAAVAAINNSIYGKISYRSYFDEAELNAYNNVNPNLASTYAHTTSCGGSFKVYFPPGPRYITVMINYNAPSACTTNYSVQYSTDSVSDSSKRVFAGSGFDSFRNSGSIRIYATNLEANQGAWINFKIGTCDGTCSGSKSVVQIYHEMDLEQYTEWYDYVTDNNLWQSNGDPPLDSVSTDPTDPTDPIDTPPVVTNISDALIANDFFNVRFTATVTGEGYTDLIWNFTGKTSGETLQGRGGIVDIVFPETPQEYSLALNLVDENDIQVSGSTTYTDTYYAGIEITDINVQTVDGDPNTIQFTPTIDATEQSYYRLEWDFGYVDENDVSVTSDSLQAVHTFPAGVASYTVTLQLFDAANQVIGEKAVQISTAAEEVPEIVDLQATVSVVKSTTAEITKTVAFSAEMEGSGVSGYQWVVTSTGENGSTVNPATTDTPEFSVSLLPSDYSVALTLLDADGTAIVGAASKTVEIEIADSCTQIGSTYTSYQNGYNRGYFDLKTLVEQAGDSYVDTLDKLASYINTDLSIKIPALYFDPQGPPDGSGDLDAENPTVESLLYPYRFDVLLEMVSDPDGDRLLWEITEVDLVED